MSAETVDGEIAGAMANFTDAELSKFKAEFYDFRSEGDKRKPVTDTYKMEVQGCKNDGKSHFIAESWMLHPKNPIFLPKINNKENPKYDRRFNHVKYLLDKKQIKPAAPEWVLDGDHKFKEMDRANAFHGKPIFWRDLWHPSTKFPTMQDPIAWVTDVGKFLRMCSGFEEGLGALEDSSFLTTQIQTYVQYWLKDHPDHKELPLGHLPKYGYEDWGIRNAIWDFIGGFIQRLPIHFILTTKMGDRWDSGHPTEEQEAKRYKNTPHFFNVIVKLWRVEDANNTKFFGKISASDFTPAGTIFPLMENPSFLKVVGIVCKQSHAEFLQPFYEETGTGPEDYYCGDIE